LGTVEEIADILETMVSVRSDDGVSYRREHLAYPNTVAGFRAKLALSYGFREEEVPVVYVQLCSGKFVHLGDLGVSFLFLSGCMAVGVMDFVVAIRPYRMSLEDSPRGEFALPKMGFAI
jgi:hypothetical protein